jgi:predicted branched-subunit amino acid permease
MSAPDPQAPIPPAATAFLDGFRTAVTSVFILVTLGTFLGIGALAHDLGFTVAWALATSLLMWAAPAQVIMMTALAGGSALLEIAIAVTLSGVRLLPMAVSLLPTLRGPRTRMHHLILPAHFVAVTTWVEGLRLGPTIPRENRVAFINGMGTGFTAVALASTVAGFYLAAGLPPILAAALLFLTPLSFLMSTAGNARAVADRVALALGLVIGPALAAYQVQLDLLWAGVIAGTLGYAVQRFQRRPQ